MAEHPQEFSNTHLEAVRKRVSKLRKKHKLYSVTPNSSSGGDQSQFVGSIKEFGNSREESKIVSERVQSLEQLVALFKVDPKEWIITKWECTAYESHTRLRKYDEDFKVKTGYARKDDEHKVVPLYRCWAHMERNTPAILIEDVKAEVLAEMKTHAPVYQPMVYAKSDALTRPSLLEISLYDLHFGKMCWGEEVGQDFDIKIAKQRFLKCVKELIDHSKPYNVERIVFPIGNDFFNVDTLENTTAKGTPQDEDTRWKKTFKRGRELMVAAIDMLRTAAPVDILVIPGNHDKQRSFYLGEVLDAHYTNCPDVTVDNTARARKYYKYGHSLIGYTHGSEEPVNNLPMVMASEMKPVWDVIKYAEWHLGDIHHKKDIKWLSTEDMMGIAIRFMRSLTSTDEWHDSKAYVGNPHAGEAFIWDKNYGMVCQFGAIIEDDRELARSESLSGAKTTDGSMWLKIQHHND
jgi:hypothetical protein